MAVDVEVVMSELNLLVPVDGDGNSHQQHESAFQMRPKRDGQKLRKLEEGLFEVFWFEKQNRIASRQSSPN